MGISREKLNPERIEKIISGVLQEMPESISISEMRNLVVELLFGLYHLSAARSIDLSPMYASTTIIMKNGRS